MQAFSMRTDELAGVTLDVLLFTAVDFEDMHQRAEYLDVGDVSIPVASIDDLITLKQAAGRAIDLSDIAHLKKIKDLIMQNQPDHNRFNPDDRTYHVSEERLKAFKALTPAQRLKWVEELAYFLRLAKEKSTTPNKSNAIR